jgi:hypothetical protein
MLLQGWFILRKQRLDLPCRTRTTFCQEALPGAEAPVLPKKAQPLRRGPNQVLAGQELSFPGRLPDRETRAGGPPGIHHLAIRARPLRYGLQKVQQKRRQDIRHDAAFPRGQPRLSSSRTSSADRVRIGVTSTQDRGCPPALVWLLFRGGWHLPEDFCGHSRNEWAWPEAAGPLMAAK